MTSNNLQETLKTVKDLILFDSAWNKRNKLAKNLPKKAIKRLEVYRDLVKNSLYDVISNIYPLTNQLLKKDWKKILSKYIETYPPYSPILTKVAEDFPQFLQEQSGIMRKYPFITELALYEWREVEIYERESNGVKNKTYILNPIHELCNFEYPIPEIIEKIRTAEPQKEQKRKKEITWNIKKKPTHILIYRDPKYLNVRFFELSPAVLDFIEMVNLNFPKGKIIQALTYMYDVKKSDLLKFKKNIDTLIKTLKKNKILI